MGAGAKGIAVVGMACRFPGASDWRQYWKNLCDGVESVSFLTEAELLAAGNDPAEVCNPEYVKAAFMLPDAEGFDTNFWGYSPHEARLIDPQQRHLLEVAWEAFEDAGYRPGQDSGPVGVYAASGSVVTNYMMNVLSDHPDARGHTASVLHIGNDKDFAGTRISFKLDLTGPSLNVQTACSTSLVLMHLACRAIRDGECKMAMAAAGVMRVPQVSGYVGVKGAVFAPDGHIRPFDAKAEGTVFSSGIAAVLLKDAEQAIADGDHIYAVIKGSACNNDGARKASYAGTSVHGQTEVMVGALKQAGFDPAEIGYVECHGTGTTVGDPREFTALNRATNNGGGRRDKCPIGSAKPNIGHSEQSAGLASLIKTALALETGRIPPTINFRTPNPRLHLERSAYFVNTELRAWSDTGGPRKALINGLGIGGTNAALALEQAPRPAPGPEGRKLQIVAVSGKTPKAVTETAARHRAWLGEHDAPLADLCYTLTAGRSHFERRFAAVVASPAEMAAKLAEPACDKRLGERKVAFLYSGQGAQMPGMGRALYEAEPAFRAALDAVAEAMAPHLDRPLLEVMFEGGDAIHQTGYTQPALFAVEVATAALLEGWGIRPDAVAGHSVGEFAACTLAGVYTLGQAARLVCARGRAMQALPRGGAMAALFADEAAVKDAIAGMDADKIGIAAANGPAATVVSGDEALVKSALDRLGGKLLTVSHAFHSPLMQPALAELESIARQAEAKAPTLPWVSTLTGLPQKDAPTPGYWCDQARGAVRFADAVAALAAQGITDFVEIGPGASLLALGQGCRPKDGLAWIPTLGKADECRSVLDAVCTLYRRGQDIDWEAFHRPWPRRRLNLPPYAFQHERVWANHDWQPAGPVRHVAVAASGLAGRRLASPLPAAQFESVAGRSRLPWLDDHRVHGAIVMPTTAGLVAALEAGRETMSGGPLEVTGFTHGAALVLGDDDERTAQLIVEPAGAFAWASLNGEAWHTHMSGTLAPALAADKVNFNADAIRRRCSLPVTAERYYAACKVLGLGYGPAFRGVQTLWRGQSEALARVRLPDSVGEVGNGLPHPALLDACLHVYPAVVEAHGDFSGPPPEGAVIHLPMALERFAVHPTDQRELWVHARRGKDATIDIDAFDLEGRRVAVFAGLTVKALPPEAFRPANAGDGWLYRVRWDEKPAPAAAKNTSPVTWLLLGGDALAPALEEALAATGAASRRIPAKALPDEYSRLIADFAVEAGAGRAGIVWMGALDVGPEDCGDETAQRRALGGALELARALSGGRTAYNVAPRLWLLSRNAVAASGHEPPAEVLQAGLWGFGRSLALEAPAVWAGLVDVEGTAAQAPLLAAQLSAEDGESQVALRGSRRLAARLVRLPPPPRRTDLPKGGSYLVTGGLGALGIQVAEWLARSRQAETVVLVSRQGAKAANAAEVKARIEALGPRVVIARADTSVEAQVRKLLKQHPGLTGIYHSAGVLDDGLAERMDWPRFRRALAPKLDAGWWLHKHSAGLKEFVLFSSVLSLIGSGGQINYTAGNACLDALAGHRRRLGLPALAVNWGPWAEAGLAAELGEVWAARGMHSITPELGRQAFDALFDAVTPDHAAVAVADWPAFLRQFPVPPKFYAELQGGPGGGLAADIEDLKGRLAEGSPSERRDALVGFIAGQVMATLGLAEQVDTGRPLRELGLDSLMAVTLINRVEQATGTRIPAPKLIRGPSIDQLVDEVWPDLAGAAPLAVEAAAVPEETPQPRPDGNSGRWLVTMAPRAKPRFRLFCFPFAGGGSAAFQNWAAGMGPAIEVIAVEPPGRLARITETPVTEMDEFVDCVLDEMDDKLDVPFALFGHCLGGLTLYEVARTLIAEGGPRPRHLFCSGARSPDRVRVIGEFEKNLARHLAAMPGYDPRLPPYRQADPIFAEIIRHFDMAATDQFLDDPELRRLMLPAVRAEFEMTSLYRYRAEKPWDIPITCFISKGDPYVSRQDVLGWGRFTNTRMQVHMREGTHYSVFEDAAFIQRIIGRELMSPPS